MTPNRTIRRRAAFTLVELMVSAAVCVLIMAILSQAFVISSTTMRELKATGDLTDQIRAAGIVIREDLRQNHFLPDDNRENLGLKVSDQRLDRHSGTGAFASGYTPPGGGFFRARSWPSFIEGYDNDTIGSYRAGAAGPTNNMTGHYLHFTSVKPGGRDQDTYNVTVTNPTTNATTLISSRAAEIAYFLDPTPQGATGPGGPNYYNLIRRQRLVAMNSFEAQGLPAFDSAVMSVARSGAVNTMGTITNPLDRLGRNLLAQPVPSVANGDNNMSASPTRLGDDVLLSHVVSFEVKLQWQNNPNDVAYPFRPRLPRSFVDPSFLDTSRRRQNEGGFDFEATSGPGSGSTDYPLDSLPRQSTNTNFDDQFVFDTWSTQVPGWDANRQVALPGLPAPPTTPGAIPMRVRVLKAKITVRVWDPKLKLTRQATFVQDL